MERDLIAPSGFSFTHLLHKMIHLEFRNVCSLFSLRRPRVVTPDPTRSQERLWKPSSICLSKLSLSEGRPPHHSNSFHPRAELHKQETSFSSVQTLTGRTGISSGWDLRAETFLSQAPPLPVSVNAALKDKLSGPVLTLHFILRLSHRAQRQIRF